MSFYDWMLALHVLSGFAIATAFVLFSVLVFLGPRTHSAADALPLFRLGSVGGVLVGVGSGLALVLGVILAVDHDDYQLWDGWVMAALVLFAVMGLAGQRTGAYYTETQKLAERGGAEAEALERLRAPTGRLLHAATVALFLLIVLDMIFKPGA